MREPHRQKQAWLGFRDRVRRVASGVGLQFARIEDRAGAARDERGIYAGRAAFSSGAGAQRAAAADSSSASRAGAPAPTAGATRADQGRRAGATGGGGASRGGRSTCTCSGQSTGARGPRAERAAAT